MPFCFVGIFTCQKKNNFQKIRSRVEKTTRFREMDFFPTVRPTTAFLDSPIRFFVPQKWYHPCFGRDERTCNIIILYNSSFDCRCSDQKVYMLCEKQHQTILHFHPRIKFTICCRTLSWRRIDAGLTMHCWLMQCLDRNQPILMRGRNGVITHNSAEIFTFSGGAVNTSYSIGIRQMLKITSG